MDYETFRKMAEANQHNLEQSQARANSGAYRVSQPSIDNTPTPVMSKYDTFRNVLRTSTPVPPEVSSVVDPKPVVEPKPWEKFSPFASLNFAEDLSKRFAATPTPTATPTATPTPAEPPKAETPKHKGGWNGILDNPIVHGITNTAKAIDVLSQDVAKFATPDAPMFTKDGKLDPNMTAREQFMLDNPQKSTGNEKLDKALDVGGQIGSLFVPVGTGGAFINDVNKGTSALLSSRGGQIAENLAGKVGAKIANVVNPMLVEQGISLSTDLAQKAAQAALRGATLGAGYGALEPLRTGDGELSSIPKSVAENAALFAAGDALLPLLGAGAKAVVEKVKPQAKAPSYEGISLSPGSRTNTPTVKPLDVPVAPATQTLDDLFPRTAPVTPPVRTLDDIFASTVPETSTGIIHDAPLPPRSTRGRANPISQAMQEMIPPPPRVDVPPANAPSTQGASAHATPNVGSNTSALQAMESDLLAKSSYSTDDIYHAGRLVRQLQDTAGKSADQVAADSRRAATLVDTLSSQLTKSGQSIEAANVWNMLSPDSYVIALERNLERVNRLSHGDNASRYVHMTPDEVANAHGIAELAQRVGVHASEARQVGIMLRLKSNVGNLSPEDTSTLRGFLRNMESLRREGHLKGLSDATVQRYRAVLDQFVGGDARLTPQSIDFLRSTSLKISRLGERERKLALQDMQAIKNGQDELEFKLGRKLATMQYLSMLYNVPSQLRNIIGNTTMYAFDRLSHTISLPFDMLRSKLTGRARQIYFTTGEGVAETFFDGLTTAVPVLSRDWREGLALGAKAGWNGVNPEGLSSKYELGGFAFSGKGKFNIGGKTMRFLEKTLGATMKGFDHAQYNRAYQTRLQESAYARALEVAKDVGKAGDKEFIRQQTEMLMHNVDNYINQVSKQYGQYVTLQDDSLLARLLIGFRRGANKLSTLGASSEFGLGSIIMPFAKVPANLVMRAIDYSPLGVARSVMNLRKVKAEYDRVLKEIADNPSTHDVAKQNLATTKLSDADWSLGMSVGRAIMGTSLGALTWHFASKGLIWSNSSGDQKTREFDQAQGKGAFQINISGVFRAMDHMLGGGSAADDVKSMDGDLLVSYDWLQPLSFPIAMGSTIYTQGNDPTTKRDVGARVVDGASTAFDTLFQSSPLRGLKDMFRTSYGEDSFSQQLVRNLATTGITQLVPAMARQLKQTMDNKYYETYDPNLKTSILNKAKVNIPFIDTNLPESVTTMGTKMPREQNALSLLNPFRTTSYSTDDDIKFVADLFNDTGDTGVLPNVASKTVSVNTPSGPQSVQLSAVEWTKLQEMMGNEMIRRLGMINPNLPLDQKEFAVKNVISGVGTFARNTLIHDKRQQEPDFFNGLNLK
jgi:hypothetical protein